MLLLSGVVVGSFAGALMSAIIVLSPTPRPSATPFSGCWAGSAPRRGSRSASSRRTPSLPLAVIVLQRAELDLLALGEEPAHHLGADVERTRRLV